MNYDELKLAKRKMESDILNCIIEFEKKTGYELNDINFTFLKNELGQTQSIVTELIIR